MSNNQTPQALQGTDLYMNRVQTLCRLVDSNKLYAVWGRGTGKTAYVTTPRIITCAGEMPGETASLSHKSFVALFQNVIPTILATFNQEIVMPDGSKRAMLREGLDYVVGQKDLPRHFHKPRFPMLYPERTIVFANGFNIQAVSTDRPDSIAGRSLVHAFFEEMKYSDGEKVRSRIIPAIRTSRIGSGSEAHRSHLHGGITGVSDIGRMTIGEDNWFTDYEKDVNPQLIEDIVNLALLLSRAEQTGNSKRVEKYAPLLAEMRKKAVYYLRASTFANRDVLGFDYFRTQYDSLSESEFLSSICSVIDRNRENLFFELWDESKHTFTDSYKYQALDKLNLRDSISIDASFLSHYNPSKKILIGFDPGSFASMVVAQENKDDNTLYIQKEFFVFPPDDLPDMARAFNSYFGPAAKNRTIDLYYDRAGNKRNIKRENETDAKTLAAELRKLGWTVTLKCQGQPTIYHYEHYRLWKRLLAETERKVPHIRIDANECPYLVSAMYCCKKLPGSNPVELDKRPEKSVRIELQAGLTPQIPSAMTYLVWGLYSGFYSGVRAHNVAAGV